MRPAVIASVARNRKQGAKRIRLMSPQFSGRRFIVMIFVGTLIFAPGVAMTILGISNDEDIDDLSPAHGVLYKVIGPAACGIGICILIAAVMYYFCYGLANTTRPRHHQSTTSSGSHHNRQSSHSSSHSHSHSHPQQDALIDNEKQHRHKQHRHHHSKQKKVTKEETNEC